MIIKLGDASAARRQEKEVLVSGDEMAQLGWLPSRWNQLDSKLRSFV